MEITTRPNFNLIQGAIAIAMTTTAYSQVFNLPGTGQPPAPPAPPKVASTNAPAVAAPAPTPGPVGSFFNVKIPEALSKGKFNLNARLRYESVDQDGAAGITDDSNAATIRTRFGYTTAPLYGFQGMLEGENVTVIGSKNNFNAAGSNGQGRRPAIADPATTELNQAWVSYTYTNLLTLKGGRQRIALDNHRFIGDVGWRQNMQTYDAVTAESKPLAGVSLFYGYMWEANRVFGDVSGLPAGNRDFKSDSHLFNAAYTGWKYGKFVGYTYLLDLENAAGFANSAATYGGYFAGMTPVTEKISVNYRTELAFQTDYGSSLLDYSAEYFNIEAGATMKPFSVGAGYELLGSDDNDGPAGGLASFRTPLATLHAFNGWADSFLTTPPNGLRDAYVYGQVVLPWQMPLRVVWHKYDSDKGSVDFGNELNAMISKSCGKNWTTMLKYAYHDGKGTLPDTQKFWAQVEFNF